MSKETDPKDFITNAAGEKRWARVFTCKFLEPGVVSYAERNLGIGYVAKKAIDNSLDKWVGKPLIITHQDVNPDNMQDLAVGYITKAFYNDVSGWYEAEGICFDPEAMDLIESGYKVSCGYKIVNEGPAGRWHNIEYNFEIVELEPEHIAIVSRPRYENAEVILNSRDDKIKPINKKYMFSKLFKKKQDEKVDIKLVNSEGAEVLVSPEELKQELLNEAPEASKPAKVENGVDSSAIINAITELQNSIRLINEKIESFQGDPKKCLNEEEKKDEDKAENEVDEKKEDEEKKEVKKAENSVPAPAVPSEGFKVIHNAAFDEVVKVEGVTAFTPEARQSRAAKLFG